ncbi:fructose bisphosphate aldolase [Aeromicrobium chenweiae]|uniref:fructose-bisphosphate aldolase n=1 Tax=Aeromicrobium chenweiae TaxID=2079793 RepID=A0A2S0WLQ7_9ACTN|nr:fructose bisphosphate aldolase [Aeromicrobium chenweiae]AWB92278.1 fructose bisphosphate aldolase [Aeromicrobium chenweiae]TGN31438.1 fructose bisphosphate aldolase [Aeromicrobium chenweiae]
MNDEQLSRVRGGGGFFAALDQSGGSTPKALEAYGVAPDQYSSSSEMFDVMHTFRVRIATSPAFDERILGAILFEDTMHRDIDGTPSARYLWDTKRIVPFVKIDKGLVDRSDDVQVMAPIDGLDMLLVQARDHGIFGTKARSVVHGASRSGIASIVAQQFEIGEQVLAAGLVPILEPEISVDSDTKQEAESLMLESILESLENVSAPVLLKLTLPEVTGFYEPLVHHRNVHRVVALSGGYSLDEATRRLAANHGVIASFSRALTGALRIDQSDEEFNRVLDETIEKIAEASRT